MEGSGSTPLAFSWTHEYIRGGGGSVQSLGSVRAVLPFVKALETIQA
jgi:hypothetical protein